MGEEERGIEAALKQCLIEQLNNSFMTFMIYDPKQALMFSP